MAKSLFMLEASRKGIFKKISVGGEAYSPYLPPELPFSPSLDTENLQTLLEKASTAVGRLDGLSAILPDISIFLYSYVRKEAVLSSQIEETQSTLSDLLLYELEEMPGVPMDDAQEVSNYTSAITHGIKRIRDEDFPLSLRLVKEMHEILLSHGRGADKNPGEFRKSQNWIGGTRPGNALFVPTMPEDLPQALDNFEKYLHHPGVPTLIKAAIAHLQFESIHPFLDGNGRVGRLLITLLLCHEEVLKEPILYLSLYFKTHKKYYYELLQSTRETGDWEKWVAFFLEGVVETANEATSTAKKILELFANDQQRIELEGNNISAALKAFDRAKKKVFVTTRDLVENAGMSLPTAIKALRKLAEMEILREITGKQRHQVYSYDAYVRLINA